MSPADTMPYEPPHPRLTAFAVATLTALTLLLPLLGGEILFGGRSSDMLGAGYAFRLFGAEQFRATGHIPQWNPYLFGGLPFIAAMHGDIFYPTAWLRWIMPVDLAITWGMAAHFILAAYFGWCLGRALGLSWTAAMIAGVSYQMSGIVASQVSPGHDGKLFVSALAPLAFLALLRAIRLGQARWFGWFAVIVGLCVLSPHYQMTYFLLLALGGWTIYLAWFDPERQDQTPRLMVLAWATLAVLAGIAIAGLQILPFLQYIPYSPRATGGPNTGWAYVNLFALPPSETMTAIMPEFNGVLDHYWGQNVFKLHTEYVGVTVVMLATMAWGGVPPARRRLLAFLAGMAVLFLLFAYAGHTPFYRPWFELLPMLKKLRAMGMVFYLVALPVCLMAGMGAERLLAGEISARRGLITAVGFGLVGLLAIGGVLQVIAEGLASADRMELARANAGALRSGGLRVLVTVAVATAAGWAVMAGRARGALAAGLGLSLVTADLWAVDHLFFDFSPRASVLFGQDEVTTYLGKVPTPFRVLDPGDTYRQAGLMVYRVESATGYHGNELRYYDELGGKARGWASLGSPSLLDLLAIRFVILDRLQDIPGFHKVVGPVTTARGATAVLYEQDSIPPYARVVNDAAKLPEDQMASTVADPRFPTRAVVVFPDSADVSPDPIHPPLAAPDITAKVSHWAPGAMTVELEGSETKPAYLVVSENWYPDWRATVDGVDAPVLRGNHSLISLVLPPGAKRVELRFDSQAYRRGKLVSLVGLLVAVGLILTPGVMGRRGRS